MVLTTLEHNILFRARHILGVHNTRAVYISRFQVEQFKQISPGAGDLPTLVPTHLLPQSWSLNAKDYIKFRPVLRLPETLYLFTTITILYLTTLHLGAKKRSLKHVRAKTMYTINTIQYIQFISGHGLF